MGDEARQQWTGPIEAVVLDAGGVLLLPDQEAIRAAVGPYVADVPDDATCNRNHYRLMGEVDRIMEGVDTFDEPDWTGLDATMATYFGVGDEHVDAVRPRLRDVYLATPWVAAPGAVGALLALQAAGYPLAVVSNAGGDMEEQLETRQICAVDGQSAQVAIVVDSHRVGVAKPDPRIFGYALEALEIAAERCLYVGDTVHFDVKGARNAGLQPVHVDPHGFCGAVDHPHVGALADLPPLLGPYPGATASGSSPRT
ncbi:MAG: HAD family hydrolase [Actinomycetota bacterium]